MNRPRTALLVLLVLLVTVAQRPARAEEPTPAEKLARGKALYAEGLKHFNAGRYDEAITAYQLAFELTSTPGLLYNIGQVYRRKEAWADAAAYYERYLAADPHGKLADEARAKLREVRAKITTQAGALSTAPPPRDAAAAPPVPPPRPRRDPRRLQRTLFVVSASVTALATLGFIYAGSQVLSLEDDIHGAVDRWVYDGQQATFPDDVCREAALVGYETVANLCDRRDARVLQTNILIGASVVGLAVSGWFYYRGWIKESGRADVAVIVSPNAAEIQAVVTF